ncbi:MAG: hypothetical protein CM1200mP2_27320 [Planctomycetaceae bacterium]|nr:MAG: hypothetical protein CM1200mP2_27320 [Planctomycetaceae bacterium]
MFSVQPLFARMVLPSLGGAPAVWNSCLFFFQGVLLAGYLYVHVISRFLAPRRQLILHGMVLCLPLLCLPIVLRQPLEGGDPGFLRLLVILGVSLGGPVFAVCTTTPLLQKWFSAGRHPLADDPYFPVCGQQSRQHGGVAELPHPAGTQPDAGPAELGWACGYGAVVVLTLSCGVMLWRQGPQPLSVVPSPKTIRLSNRPGGRDGCGCCFRLFRPVGCWPSPPRSPVNWSPFRCSGWCHCRFTFLTFILAFSRWQPMSHVWMVRSFPVAILLLLFLRSDSVLQEMVKHLAVFFVGAMVFHGELARRRPGTSRLTAFYVWMAVGGVLGGMFNSLVGPLLFPSYWEYPLTLLLACLLFWRFRSEHDPKQVNWWVFLPEGMAVAVVLLLAVARGSLVDGLVTVVPLVILGFLAKRLTLVFALGVGVVLLATEFGDLFQDQKAVLHSERTFFGVHRVLRDVETGFHELHHGRTMHGMQNTEPSRRHEPLAYFHRSGPLGQVFDEFSGENAKSRIAVVGLGTGTMVAYREPGQHFTFYEIDPSIKRIAESPHLFTYLSDSGRDAYDIVVGDGRLMLARARDKSFGMIILDAFSSDVIPVHLLTREALELYYRKLSDDGFLVIHISNPHVSLGPVLGNLAADAGSRCWICRDQFVPTGLQESGREPTLYAVIAREEAHLGGLLDSKSDLPWIEITPDEPEAAWTDDFSDVFNILR